MLARRLFVLVRAYGAAGWRRLHLKLVFRVEIREIGAKKTLANREARGLVVIGRACCQSEMRPSLRACATAWVRLLTSSFLKMALT